MMSDNAKEFAGDVVSNSFNVPLAIKPPIVAKKTASSSSTLGTSLHSVPTDQSQMSGDIDRWMNNDTQSFSVDSGVQGPNTFTATVQRSTLVPTSSLNNTNIWYLLAMAIPLFNVNNTNSIWRCTPSTLLGTAEVFLNHLNRVCERVHANMRRLAEEQFARDVFAAAMDVVLVIYAMGFLVISLYQAHIIG